ncbi:hypothetical protein, partial [Kluyvera sp. Awk 3]|uniref:hypothetical protein n=1 Tax=Kluyvera sp. Awk 3 TaxID=2963956 RepID=UPI0023041C5C
IIYTFIAVHSVLLYHQHAALRHNICSIEPGEWGWKRRSAPGGQVASHVAWQAETKKAPQGRSFDSS